MAAALIMTETMRAAAGEPAAPPAIERAVAAAVRHDPPKGWTPVAYANSGGADLVLRYEKGLDVLQIRVFGTPGSAYATPEAFLKAPGQRPVIDGTTTLAGKARPSYVRRFPLDRPASDSASARAPNLGVERFCVLPLTGGRFAVISYLRSSPGPDPAGSGSKAWSRFLKTVGPNVRR
jgi:hypothetical protein